MSSKWEILLAKYWTLSLSGSLHLSLSSDFPLPHEAGYTFLHTVDNTISLSLPPQVRSSSPSLLLVNMCHTCRWSSSILSTCPAHFIRLFTNLPIRHPAPPSNHPSSSSHLLEFPLLLPNLQLKPFDVFQTNKSLLKIRAYQLELDSDRSQILEWQISDSKCLHT